jgi:tRNA G18 (ribose-2'-O)-methylase SpoU
LEAQNLGADFLYGVNPVLNALQCNRRKKIHKLLMQESMDLKKRKDASAVLQVEELAARAGVPIERQPKAMLNTMCDNRFLIPQSIVQPITYQFQSGVHRTLGGHGSN